MEEIRCRPVRRMAVCGGTHGNELAGVYLLREWQTVTEGKQLDSFSVTTVLSNPCAVQKCQRYTQMDLNRCFTAQLLSTPVCEDTPYEVCRAQELNALLGPRGSAGAMDLVCDLHNTTANMGVCVIAYSDHNWFCMHAYRHLQKKITSVPVRYLQLDRPLSEAYSLESVGKLGLTLEVGPQAHGVLRADIFCVMKEAVLHLLDWIQHFNSGGVCEPDEVEIYTVVRRVDFPRDAESKAITAVIHPQLQDRDFCVLKGGEPVFLSFTGEPLRYEGDEPLHPLFINESAYYEKGVAFMLARKSTVKIPSVQVTHS